MSELCLSSTSKTHFSSLLISNFYLLCSFIVSHPLYFTYFIFFSPYLLKLLSFLSPLVITTSLLLLSLLTLSRRSFTNDNFTKESSHSGALITTYHAVVQILRSKLDDHAEELPGFEDFEVFKIVFDNPMIHDAKGINQVEVLDAELKDGSFQAGFQEFSLSTDQALARNIELENLAGLETTRNIELENLAGLETNCGVMDEFEKVKVTTSVEKKKFEPPCTYPNKEVENQGEKSVVRNGSEAAGNKIIRHSNSVEVGREKGRDYNKSKLLKAHSHSIGASSADYTNENSGNYYYDCNLGSYGSLRREKDWKRTLACKLFEERNNNRDGESEGMDLLWETYEIESTKSKGNNKNKNKINKNTTKKKKNEMKSCEGEEISYDDEADDGQLCCLQALKFSAGKMNLGMGRPNLVKFSKAIKGIGWLHNLSRHSKKVHNGDRY
ncbi:hypothetical protein ACH5RR_020422 [Cinchona calisaya]|uniref:Uncharacterized protein n=1 Tax=Cinchona calisaya TaxID=153742 RepID=A0ABD2ZJE0_9GENT